MKNRVRSLVLVLCVVLSMTTAAWAAEYADTDGHWAESSIARWSDLGIVGGTGNLFAPDSELTRGQLAAIIARLLKLPDADSAGFADTAGHWAENVIDRCFAAGIMGGDGVNARPDDTVSREETMVMLGRALGIRPVPGADLSAFNDDSQVSDWAVGYVAAMTEAGIIGGINCSIAPAENINRAAVVTMLDRAVTSYVTEPGTVVEANGGIVVVAAENVTITGQASSIVVPSVVTAPTCTAKGYTTYITCCGYSYTGDETAMYVHQDGVQCPYCKVTEVKTTTTLKTAVEAGGNIIVVGTVEVIEAMTVSKDTVITIGDGASIDASALTANRPFHMGEGASLTINGGDSENTIGAYGWVNVPNGVEEATIVINGGTYSGTSNSGAFIRLRDNHENITVVLTDVVYEDKANNGYVVSTNGSGKITVSGGSYSANYGFQAPAGTTITGTTITTKGSAVEAVATGVVVDDCRITVNPGVTVVRAPGSAIAVSYGGSVTVKNSEIPVS